MAREVVQDIAFSSRCESLVLRFIKDSEEIQGCVAWLTSPIIIHELSRVPRCHMVVTADTVHNRAASALRSINARQVGRARGRYRALMHHKFLVRFTAGQPSHVLMGSYNFTRRSNHNIGESALVIQDAGVARRFADEFDKAYRASRPIRLNDRR